MLVEQRSFSMVEFPTQVLEVGSQRLGAREEPVHEVELGRYALADRCVTAGEFHAFLHEAPNAVDHTMIDCIDPCFVVHRASGFALRSGCADLPMIQISYWAAAAFCNWLSRSCGLQPVYDLSAREADLDRDGYRLPTEAEWEAACRRGSPHTPDAATADPGRCNTADATAAVQRLRAGHTGTGNFPPDHPSPVPVGSLPPDAAGLYEMLGNLREWCHDRFGPYPAQRVSAPRGPQRGSFRVVRGGAFIDPADQLGPATRMAAYEDTKCEVYGFRVARTR